MSEAWGFQSAPKPFFTFVGWGMCVWSSQNSLQVSLFYSRLLDPRNWTQAARLPDRPLYYWTMSPAQYCLLMQKEPCRKLVLAILVTLPKPTSLPWSVKRFLNSHATPPLVVIFLHSWTWSLQHERYLESVFPFPDHPGPSVISSQSYGWFQDKPSLRLW